MDGWDVASPISIIRMSFYLYLSLELRIVPSRLVFYSLDSFETPFSRW